MKIGLLALLLALCLLLSGCRTRTTAAPGREAAEPAQEAAGSAGAVPGEPEKAEDAEDSDQSPEEIETPGGQTRENPEAARKEFDERAAAEILPGLDRLVQAEGEGEGAPVPQEEASLWAHQLNDAAEETATQRITVERAEELTVSEEAKEADSAMTYYSVLLRERVGSLFECQRLNVYWETPEDHRTVYKTSLEHTLILDAGAYDVSARLLQENLRVDDGWIGRKNPGLIVKAVEGSVLGSGVSSDAAARRVCAALLARDGWAAIDAVQNGRVLLLSQELLLREDLRLAAMLMLAKVANPDLFADVDVEKALQMLAEEATGILPAGVWFYVR